MPEKSLGDAFENNLLGRTSLGSKCKFTNILGSESYDHVKEMAKQVAGRVGEKANELKSQAMDWFSQVT